MTEQQPAGRSASRGSRTRRSRSRRGSALVALLVAVGALVLAVTALSGWPALAGAVFVLQVMSVVGAFRMAAATPEAVNVVLGLAAAVAVDVSLLFDPDPASLRPLAAVLAGAFLAALLIQLARWHDRSGVMPALTTCLFSVVLVIMAACWLAGAGEAGRNSIVVALAAMGVGALVEAGLAALRASAAVRALLTVALAAGAGAAAGAVSPFGVVVGVGAGFVVGLFVAAAFAVVAMVRADTGGRIMVAVAVPLVAVAPPAYLLSRLLSG